MQLFSSSLNEVLMMSRVTGEASYLTANPEGQPLHHLTPPVGAKSDLSAVSHAAFKSHTACRAEGKPSGGKLPECMIECLIGVL